jgi:hypothetical protein
MRERGAGEIEKLPAALVAESAAPQSLDDGGEFGHREPAQLARSVRDAGAEASEVAADEMIEALRTARAGRRRHLARVGSSTVSLQPPLAVDEPNRPPGLCEPLPMRKWFVLRLAFAALVLVAIGGATVQLARGQRPILLGASR